MFQKGAAAFKAIAGESEGWDPLLIEPRRAHNMYANNLATAYSSKFEQLSTGMSDAIHRRDYLSYALCARSLLESTATLRYYIETQYAPILNRRNLSPDDFRTLLSIHDRHLRGGRFDWNSYISGETRQMVERALEALKDRKAKKKHIEDLYNQQVNVLTCIENWGENEPAVLFVYSMFCELVHPNVGSNFLVASTAGGRMHFHTAHPDRIGEHILNSSLPLLASTVLEPFARYLSMLRAMQFQADEL